MRRNIALLIYLALISILFQLNLFAQIPPYLDPTVPIEQRVNDLMGRMSLDEKIGQMMQVDLGTINSSRSDITSYFIGSVLSGGDADPGSGNDPLSWVNTYDALQTYALNTPLKIPIIYGIDAVHGHNNVIGATIFPHNIGLGCTRNPELVKQVGRVTATEVAATGIDWTFAPCIAVARNEKWGRTYESFGETPELAQLLGSSEVAGLQGDTLSDSTSILACAKHFLGDGGTTNGVDQGNTELSESDIRKIHLPGYISTIDSGTGSIMVSFSSINGQKMHGNKYWITDVLKKELGFDGIVISDWDGINQLSGDYKTCVEQSINAGIDMVMMSSRYADFLVQMKSLVNEGKITVERIDDAVKRILTAKFKLGLFEKPFSNRSLLPLIGCTEHRAIARQCVRESLVLLKKKDGILPLPKSNTRILVAGSNADDIGNQCGGWTITWQGRSGNTTTGTTILQGMRNAAPNVQIEYSLTGDFPNTDADYSVVIIGETPYAEGQGDKIDLSISRSDVELVKKMKSFGHPVIVILVSGRPMIIEKILHYSDVIIAAWLPGTEGEGVSDVLFGDYQPKGILSHSWPRSMSQVPINIGDANYNPLYAYGYGITTLSDSPIGSSPVLTSAIVTEDGKHIELTFNKAMESPFSKNFQFSIFKNNSSYTEIYLLYPKENDSTTIVISLNYGFKKGDSASVAYIGGDLESSDGGMLQPFGPIDIYNFTSSAVVNIPGKIEAEGFNDMFGVTTEPTSDFDGALDVTNIDSGDWLEYLINVDKAGTYKLSIRYASQSGDGNISLYSNSRLLGTRSLASTGSIDTWQTVAQVIGLNSGQQTLRLNATTGGFKLNWLSIDEISTAVEDNKNLPQQTRLLQNYPNPFNPSTIISYQLSANSLVKLCVYDILGKEVAILVDEVQKAGNYNYKFSIDKFCIPSGIYFCRLKADSYIQVMKMILSK
jgi:beta-glucosidase